MRLVHAALAALALCTPALAHDDGEWINRGGFRNGAGEWCCGADDCLAVEGVRTVSLPGPGYRLPDGEFWRCGRPDGSRRCFFAPPPNS